MNKVYRLVWNAALGAWVVACEFATAKGKGKSGNRRLAIRADAATEVDKSKGKGVGKAALGALAGMLVAGPAMAFIATGANEQPGASDGGNSLNTAINGGIANAAGGGAVAIGPSSTASVANSVALGSGSVANTNAGVVGYDPRTGKASTAVDATWKSTLANVSVGDVATGKTRQITSVAAGTQATDAVNVAQLQSATTHYFSVEDSTNGKGGNYANDGATGANSLAAGYSASATGTSATALGYGAKASGGTSIAVRGTASGDRSIAMGDAATALSDHGVAIGSSTQVESIYGVAIGYQAAALGTGAGGVAVGDGAKATGVGATALGYSAKARADGATALGTGADAADKYSVAVGANSLAQNASLTSGYLSKATGNSSAAYGYDAKALGDYSVALGSNTKVSVAGGVALGQSSVSDIAAGVAGYDAVTKAASTNATSAWKSTLGAVSVGEPTNFKTRQITNMAAGSLDTDAVNVAQLKNAVTAATTHYYSVNDGGTKGGNYNNDGATGTKALAAGVGATATGGNGVAIGTNAQAGSATGNTIAIGTNTVTTGSQSTAMGFTATASGANAVAVGSNASASGGSSVAIGDGATGSSWGTGVGFGAKTTDTAATALGYQATAGYYGTALGAIATAGGNATAVGNQASATGTASLASGYQANTTAQYGTAVGAYTKASGQGSVALGGDYKSGASAIAANSVALGSSSVANVGKSVVGYNPVTGTASTNVDPAWKSTVAAVSVGDVDNGITRQIVSVAAGTKDTDAVNVAQLKAGQTHYYSVNDNGVHGGNYANDGATGVNALAAGVGATASGLNSTAMGLSSTAKGPSSVAIGDSALADQQFGIAIGSKSKANGEYSTAIGDAAVANSKFGIALGWHATADVGGSGSGEGVIAIGDNANAKGTGAVTLGYNATTSNDGAVAVGYGTNASGYYSSTFGTGAKASATDATALGAGANASAATSTAVGRISSASGAGALAVGYKDVASGTAAFAAGVQSTASGDYSIAQGYLAESIGASAIGVGTMAKATGMHSVAIGRLSQANVDKGVALGAESISSTAAGVAGYVPTGTSAAMAGAINATKSTLGAVSVGDTVSATKQYRQITGVAAGTTDSDAVNVAQLKATQTHYYSVNDKGGMPGGNYANDGATGYQALAAGVNAWAEGDNSTAVGSFTNAIGAGSVAVGDLANANHDSAIAIGSASTANGLHSTAIGPNATTNADESIAIGHNARTNDDGSGSEGAIAIGGGSRAAGYGAAAFGGASDAMGEGAVALGGLAKATNAYDVALGATSVTDVAVGTTGVTIAGTDYNFAGTAPTSTVSVGSLDNERTITNVAAGRISATSTDAINGSQLFATNSAVETLDQGSVKYDIDPGTGDINYNSVTLGGDTYNSTTKIGGTRIKNVAAGVDGGDAVNVDQLTALADTPITFTGNTGSVDRKLGETFAIEGVGSTTGDYSGANLKTEVGADGKLQLLMAENPEFTSVTTGNTTINTDGLTITGGPSVTTTGIDAAGTKITSVAAGVDDTDAVNMSQLNETNENVTNLGDEVTNIYETGTKYFHANSTGADSSATGENAIAVGQEAVASEEAAIAMGLQSSATGMNAIAIGKGALAAAEGTVAIGYEAGVGTTGAGGGNVFIGSSAGARSDLGDSVAMGNSAGSDASGFGNAYVGSGTGNSSVGHANSAFGLGSGVGVTGDNNIGFGHGANVSSTGSNNIALGEMVGVLVEGNENIAQGRFAGSEVKGNENIAIGTSAGKGVTADRTIALGSNAMANNTDDVALGAGSVTDTAVGTTGVTIAGTDYNFAGTAPTSTVSVGSVGSERTITNVAAGRISATSTDAINGSQLFATNSAVEQNSTDISNVTNNINNGTIGPVQRTGTDQLSLIAIGGDASAPGAAQVLTNVADGWISDSSTDAINGSQLNETNMAVTNIDNRIGDVFGDDSTTNVTVNGRGIRYVRTNDTDLPLSDAYAQGEGSTAVGYQATAMGESSLSLGRDSRAVEDRSVAMGEGAYAWGENSMALGAGADADKKGATALGYESRAAEANSTALGTDAQATGEGAVAVGFSTMAMGENSLAAGRGAATWGDKSVALGHEAGALGESSVAIGSGAFANSDNSVALGAGSSASADLTQAAFNPSTTATIAGTSPVGEVSVGAVDAERRITNLAAGAADTDAVNVSQLKATASAAVADAVMYDDSTHNTVTLGGDTYNSTTKIGGTRIKNVAAGVDGGDAVNVDQLNDLADTPITFAGNTGSVDKKLGDTFAIEGAGTTTGSYSGANLKTEVGADGKLQLLMAENPEFTSVTTGNTTINTDGLTITGGPSVTTTGIDAADTKITNVAAGVDDTDAVNVSQLTAATADAVMYDDSTHNTVTLGGDTYNSTTKIGGTRIKNVAAGVDGGDAVNVDQLTGLGDELTAKGMDFAGNEGGTVHRDLGETLAISGEASTAGTYSGANLKTVTDPLTGAIGLQMAESPKFGNVTINDNGSGKITGVTAGTDDTDAVNVSQLTAATADAVMYDDSTHNTVTLGGDTYNSTTKIGGTRIKNVAAGVDGGDAVNVDQLTGLGDELTTKGMDFAGNEGGTVHRDLGETLAISGEASTAGTYSGANLKTVTDPLTGAIGLQMAESPKFGNVTINDSGSGKITGLTAGTDDTDAVNVSQLTAATADAVMYDDSTHNTVTLGGDTYNSTTKIGGTRIKNVAAGVDGGDAVNVDQLTGLGDELTTKGMDFAGNEGGTVHRDLGETLAISGEASTAGTYSGANLKTVTDPLTGAIGLQMAESPKFGNVTINDSGSGKITGLTAGTDDTDAVNVSQLTAATADAVMYDDSTHNTVTLGGDTYNSTTKIGGTRIKNVAAGVDGGDAVNVDQLTGLGDELTTKGMDFAGNEGGTVHRDLGETLAISGEASTAGTYSGANLKTVTDPLTGAIGLQMAESPKFGNVTINDSGSGKITGVTAGTDDTDAVNVSQLTTATADAVMYDDSTHNTVTLGGDTYNSTTKIGGTRIKNVAAGVDGGDAVNVDQLNDLADTPITFAGNSGSVDKKLGDTFAIEGAGTTAGSYSGANLKTEVGADGKLQLQMAESPKFGNVTINDNGSGKITGVTAGTDATDAVNVSQLTTATADAVMYDDSTHNTVTMGGDTYNSVTKTGGTKITNVARGEDDSDAVNMSQLNETNANVTNLGDTITNIAGDTSTTYTDVHGVGIRYARTNEAGLVQSDSSAEGQGSTAVGYNATSVGESSLALGREAQAVNKDDVALGAGSVTDAAVGTTGVTIAGTDYDFAGTNPTSTVSVGSVGNERTITNVAAGRLSADSTDAINGSQLFATNSAIDTLDQGSVKYDVDPGTGDINYNSVTLGGDTYNSVTKTGGTRIKNVAAGVDGGDAVNVDQLNDLADTPITFAGNSGSVDKKLGDTFAIEGAGTTTGSYSGANLKTEVGADGKLQLLMAESPKFGNVTINDNGSGKITGVTAGTDATDAVNVSQLTTATADAVMYDDSTHNTVTLNPGGTSTTITNLAAGELSATSTDAVNGSQLHDTNEQVATNTTNISNLDGRVTNVEGDVTTLQGDVSNLDGRVTNIYETGTKYFHANSTGADSSAVGADSVAIGMGAVSTHDNDVALGAGSVTDAAVGTTGVTIAGTDYDFAGTAPTSTVSVGSVGNERTITNVAAGRLSATSTDAVNGSQLFATNQSIETLDQGSVKYDINGDGTVNYNSVTMGGDTYNSVTKTGGTRIKNVAAGVDGGDAVNVDQLTGLGDELTAKGMDFAGNEGGTVHRDLGETLAISGEASTAGTYSGANLKTVTDPLTGAISLQMTESPKFGNVTINDNGSGKITGVTAGTDATDAVNVSQLTAATADAVMYDDSTHNTVTLNPGGTSTTITNVAAGELSATSTDAVNGSQLHDTNEQVATNTTNISNLDGRVTNVEGDVTTLQGDVSNLDGRVTNIYETGTKYFHANSTGADSQALGQDSVAIGMGAVSTNANDVALGAGSVTDAAVGTTGVTIAGTDYDFAGTTPTSTVSVGSVGSERTITNVAAGRLSATSTDAINGSQLFATNSAIDTLTDDVGNLDQNAVKYDLNGDGTVNYNSVTMGGDTYNSVTKTGGTKITNVARGEDDSDAVNMSQLNETNANVTNLGDTITNIAGDTSNTYTDVHGVGIRYARTNEAGLVQSDSSAEGQGSTAVGYNATSVGESSLALGREAQAVNKDDVALGAGSVTDAAVGTTGVTIAGTDYDFAGTAPTSTVSVGSVGNERTITNVAAGRLSATSTDAVNGSQLFATNSAIDTLTDDVGTLDQNAVKYDLNGDGTVNYNSVTMGGDTYNSVTKTGGTKITNVARGEDDSDAVNMSQLNETNANVTNLGDTITNIAGDTSNTYTDVYGRGIRYARTNEAGLAQLDAYAMGKGSTAVGYAALSSGEASVAVGPVAQADGDASLALGAGSKANNEGDVALGAFSTTDVAVATTGTTIAGKNYTFAGGDPVATVSVGSDQIKRTITNVAAGRLSADSTDAVNGSQLFATNQSIETLDQGSVKYDINGDGTVNYNSVTMGGDTYNSVTKTGGTRIKNVAAGVDGGDAVNVDQLNETNANVTNLGDTITNIAGDTSNTYTDVYGRGIRYVRTNEAGLAQLDAFAMGKGSTAVGYAALSSGEASVAVGPMAQAYGNDSLALGAGAVANNGGDVALGAGSVTKVAVATTGTTIAGKEYTFAGGAPVATVSVGNDQIKRTITNVAAGRLSADSTDAVNGSQLFATNQAITDLSSNITNVYDNGTKYFHAKSTKADSVASGEDSIAVGPNAKASGNGSVAMGNGAEAAGKGSSAMGQGATAEGASSVAMGDGAKATKEKSTAIGSGAEAKAKNAVALGADSVADRDNTVSVGSKGKERQITNVAKGTADTDAVNVAQLKDATGTVINDVTNIQNGADGMFQVNNTSKLPKPKASGTDAVAGGAGAVANGNNSMAVGTKANAAGENSVAMGNGSSAKEKNSVALGANSVADRANTVSVGSAGAERQITNVAAGTADTDAVNVAQLNKSVGDITNIANNYTDQRYNSLKRDLAEQDDTLSAGIAGAMAMASLPQPYVPGASMAAAGLGTYRGQGAVSVGVSRISDNGKWVTKLQGSTTTQGDVGVSVGVGYQW